MAALAATYIQAINLETIATLKSQLEIQDGPTNGEMTEDEKDSLIQVLCPGNVATSFTQTAGKSSTCNNGVKTAAKSLVQTEQTDGNTQIEWIR